MSVRAASARHLRAGGAIAFSSLAAVAMLVIACGCGGGDGSGVTTIRFWAMGREGEVVRDLLPEFERENPNIRVLVQQIPWTAAHEKFLTAHVGGSTPDVSQLGNTWMAEFAALRALEPLEPRTQPGAAVTRAAYFAGSWDANVIDGTLFGVPWYVDTRVVFYNKVLLARAGFDAFPETWAEWRRAMEAVKALGGEEGATRDDRFAILLPANEWAQPVILGLQSGSKLLGDNGTRGVFAEREFRDAFEFYVGLFRDGLAPPLTNNEVSNLYQEFARGYFAMYISGPWNLGEFRRRVPPEMQNDWGTAAIPGPRDGEPGVSIAGGSSLVVFRGSRNKDAAWKLVEFLSRPATQVRFYELTGDLPARVEAWQDSALSRDPNVMAFAKQLESVVPCPLVPEWELIAMRVQDRAELAVRSNTPIDSVLAGLDREVDRVLEKRRWLLGAHARGAS
ncbi:MAG: sugar ABC transporter substrate-binding protein [bacterium]